MSEQILKRFEELIVIGKKLTPQGGFDFSGYNARLQNTYLGWRKACLEVLELSGPIGIPYKNKILNDQNGGVFYQVSALLILHSINELYSKLKASPEMASAESKDIQANQHLTQTASEGVRVLKPPIKTEKKQTEIAGSAGARTVYIIGEKNNPLYIQLAHFLLEIGIEEVLIERKHGTMISFNAFQERADIQFAFFVLNEDDLAYAMFEIGHLVGKLGSGHVCILCKSEVNFPENIPGVSVKRIIIKL
ncbi:MAG: TIR domain-containing protein, partial [Bacteroidota bacterium]